jgi:hypothetical protein
MFIWFVAINSIYFNLNVYFFKNDEDSGIKKTSIRRKYFNPIIEHYSWCPWIQVLNGEKSAYQYNNEIIYRYLTGSSKQNRVNDDLIK